MQRTLQGYTITREKCTELEQKKINRVPSSRKEQATKDKPVEQVKKIDIAQQNVRQSNAFTVEKKGTLLTHVEIK